MNSPRGLREANEKLYAHHFPEIVPPTIMTSHKDEILRFLSDVGGKAVLKPIDGHGGESVFLLTQGDSNLNALIESVTHVGARNAIVQALIPEIYDEGDKRILLVDGELLGVVGRVPSKGDLRSNVHVGGSAAPAEPPDADRKIIETIGPRLVADRLFFVGLDVIGGQAHRGQRHQSDACSSRCPGSVGENLSATVIDQLEEKVRRYRIAGRAQLEPIRTAADAPAPATAPIAIATKQRHLSRS